MNQNECMECGSMFESEGLENFCPSCRPATRTVDLTPTFEEATRMCIFILENGNDEGKKNARAELLRYGRELDRLSGESGAAFDLADTPVSGE